MFNLTVLCLQLFLAWAKSIIHYESWRKMVYELWRLYPNKDNWFLKECIKVIIDLNMQFAIYV